MNLVSPTEFSRNMGISKQAVFQALMDGLLPFVKKGKRKYIDIDDEGVQGYIKNNSRQREAGKIRSEKWDGKHIKNENASNKQVSKKGKLKTKSKKPDKKIRKLSVLTDFEELSVHEINKRTKFAEMQKKQIQVEILEKNYLPRDFIEDGLFRYIEKLNSNIERSSAIFIREVGQMVLDSKEVTPKHIDKFTSLMLGLIYTTKKQIEKAIKKYEPQL